MSLLSIGDTSVPVANVGVLHAAASEGGEVPTGDVRGIFESATTTFKVPAGGAQEEGHEEEEEEDGEEVDFLAGHMDKMVGAMQSVS